MKPLSIDWLQINAGGAPSNPLDYTYKLLDYQTRHFKKVEEIYYKNQLLFINASQPHSKILKPDMNLIKFDNKFLYEKKSISTGLLHLSRLGLNIRNISRLDLAVDFNSFSNNLKPQNLIKSFINNKYLHNGRGKYKLIGRQEHGQQYSYLRFGQPKSGISVYLYDKSTELKEVKMKQYIWNKWKHYNLNTDKTVWRLEISIKSNQLHLFDQDTGEVTKMNVPDLSEDENVIKLFYSCIDKYFQFRINNKTKNKSRMKKLRLFNDIDYLSNIKFISDHKDFTRADKIFLKKLESLNQEIRGDDFELSTYSQAIINKFVKTRRLEDFYSNKVVQ